MFLPLIMFLRCSLEFVLLNSWIGVQGNRGQPGLQGISGPKGDQGGPGVSGVSYIRWGKKNCPSNGAELVYEGIGRYKCVLQ